MVLFNKAVFCWDGFNTDYRIGAAGLTVRLSLGVDGIVVWKSDQLLAYHDKNINSPEDGLNCSEQEVY